MTIYHNDWEDISYSEEEIIEKTLDHMTEEDLLEALKLHIDFDRLLEWAMTQESFYEAFYEKIVKARDDWLNIYGYWEEDDGAE